MTNQIEQIVADLTANEQAVMKAMFNNHYGTEGDGVWSWAVEHSGTPSGLAATSIPGVVGSLCKKGVYSSEEYDKNEQVLWLTAVGKEVMAALKFA